MKLILGSGFLSAVANAWTYGDISEWATESPFCADTVASQSPIDINVAGGGTGTTTNPLVFQGTPDSAINPEIRHELVVNQHTWELEWDIDHQAEVIYGTEYNNKIYALKQFHFHSPSEHTLDGEHFDLEAHMVHACYGNLTCDTIDENDENLVVAIWMNVGEAHPYLESFWPQLAELANNESAPKLIHNIANPYNSLVPPQPHDFYRYQGSTTTPSCVQDVAWFLMSTPVTLSQAQLTSYRTAISNRVNTQTTVSAQAPPGVNADWNVQLGTNNRVPQEIGNRLPEKYTEPAEAAEDASNFYWHILAAFLACLAVALCCLLVWQMVNKPKEPKAEKTKRGVTPKKPPPAEKEPLVAPPAPPLPVPMLFSQPMQVPTTYAAPMHLQPQFQQVQMQQVQTLAPQQARPFMAP